MKKVAILDIGDTSKKYTNMDIFAFFSVYHKTSYCERKKSGVIIKVKKNKDNIYEVFDECIYW